MCLEIKLDTDINCIIPRWNHITQFFDLHPIWKISLQLGGDMKCMFIREGDAQYFEVGTNTFLTMPQK
jgi:hypothetical protein